MKITIKKRIRSKRKSRSPCAENGVPLLLLLLLLVFFPILLFISLLLLAAAVKRKLTDN